MNASAKIEGLYVHVPFCDGKCAYCAFYSVPLRPELAHAWLAALETERTLVLDHWGSLSPETVYFGGGTPTLLPPAQLERLLILSGARQGAEWTVEANPGSVDGPKLSLLREGGVNRISLGVQSMDDSVLAFLGRRHSVAETRTAVAAIQSAGFDNWGLDLIACVPGVDRARWFRTIEQALALSPRHVSVYALTREEGSAIARHIDNGRVGLLDDDEQLAMLRTAEDALRAAGFERYEISNYALPGYECRHHLACWRGRNYIGLGCAASSRVGPRRWTNLPDLEGYIAALSQARTPPREEETLSDITDATERLVFGLRMAEGVDLSAILRATGLTGSATAGSWDQTLDRLRGAGLLTCAAGRWMLTDHGRELADHVAVELLL